MRSTVSETWVVPSIGSSGSSVTISLVIARSIASSASDRDLLAR